MSPAASFEARGVAVYDQVLAGDDFARLRELHEASPGEPAPLRWWPHGDPGDDVPARRGRSHHARHPPDESAALPDPVRALRDAVFAAAEAAPEVVGVAGRAWRSLSLTPWTYGPGTAFEAHVDGPEAFSGGFVFFLVDDWPLHFGGLLVVVDARPGGDAAHDPVERARRWAAHAAAPRYRSIDGISTAIHPVANRLVLLAADVVHLVTRVEHPAGPRRTYVGFFSP